MVDTFVIDVAEELQRVDDLFSEILDSEELWNEFVNDPCGVFRKKQITRDTPSSPQDISKQNNLFFHSLLNRELRKYTMQNLRRFHAESLEREKYFSSRLSGMRSGKISHHFEYDKEFVDFLIFEDGLMAETINLCLFDLNNLGLLGDEYDEQSLRDYSRRVVRAAREGSRLSDIPELEEYSLTSGVGPSDSAVAVAVVAVVALAVAAAEVAVGSTVAVAMLPPEEMTVPGLIYGDIGRRIRMVRSMNPNMSPFERSNIIVEHASQLRGGNLPPDELIAITTLVRLATLNSDLHLSASISSDDIP